MRFLSLILFIGAASCLQTPVEYHYKYESRLAAGIPSIRTQISALGIRADLIVQVKSKTDAIVQLSNVQVAEQNDDLHCSHIRRPIPFKWTEMPQQYKKQLELPFSVKLLEEQGEVMKVPSSDIEFVTNLRKAIAGSLRLEPLLANLGGIRADKFAQIVSSSKAPEAFALEEETIFGRCESQYTLIPLPNYLAESVKRDIAPKIEVDEQSQQTPRTKAASVPKIQENYYRLVRAVDFDKCHDRVVLQHAGVGNMTDLGKSQFKSVQSRSSIGTYILKGSQGAYRLERAIVEGDISSNPFGYKTHRLQAITNQTLYLTKAQAIQKDIPLPSQTKPVKTWRYEVASPYEAPAGSPKPWVNYHKMGDKLFPISSSYALLGLSPQSNAPLYKAKLIEMLDSAVQNLYSPATEPSDTPQSSNTKPSVALNRMHHIVGMLRVIPLAQVKQVFDQVFSQNDVTSQRKQMLLVDAAAASGAAAPVTILLEKMKNGQISPARAGSILFTLPNNLINPAIIPDIMEYVKTLDMRSHPVLTSSALVNFASLASRACLNTKKFNYTLANPLFGAQICKPSQILQGYLPYLQEKLKQWNRPSEKVVLIQAISNLGSPQTIPVLKPYILGTADPDPRVRSIAVYGLTKRHQPHSAREQVFDVLMEIVDNVAENTLVRQAAFITLLTWRPSATWYQRLARLTWRDPSQNFASFVTFSFESIAKSTDPYQLKQARYAAFALPLLKPFAPSIKYSFDSTYSGFDPVSKLGLRAQFVYLKSAQEMVPKTIYAALSPKHGQFNIPAFEAAFDSEGLTEVLYNVLAEIRSTSGHVEHEPHQYQHSPKHHSPRHHSPRHIRSVVDHITTQFAQNSPKTQVESTLYFRAMENMHQYIPVGKEFMRQFFGTDGQDIIKKLTQGLKFKMTKFMNPMDLEWFYPTETGLPLTGLVHLPTVLVGDTEFKLKAKDVPNPSSIRDLLKSPAVHLQFKTDFKYASKVISKVSIPAPWNKKVVESGVENLREVNLPVEGELELKKHNLGRNLTLSLTSHQPSKVAILHSHNLPFTTIRDFVPSPDVERHQKVVSVLKNRRPLVVEHKRLPREYVGMDVELKYAADVSEPISSEVIFDYLRKPESLIKALVTPTAKQYQYTVLMKPTEEAKHARISLSYFDVKHYPSDLQQSPEAERAMRKLRHLASGSEVHSFNVELAFSGRKYIPYELAVATSAEKIPSGEKLYKLATAAVAPTILGSPEKTMCTVNTFKTPKISDLQSLKQALRSKLEETLDTHVYFGRHCTPNEKLAYIQGKLEVSPQRASAVSSEIETLCNYDNVDPVVELRTAAVYDKGHVKIDYEKERLPLNIKNLTYQLQDVIEGIVYPHGYYNHLHRGEEGHISVELHRPLSSHRYTFNVESPQKRSIYSELYVPETLTRIVPWSGLRYYSSVRGSPENPQTMVLASSNNICRITHKNVVTYDSLNFEYKPLNCWTLSAVDSRNIHDFAVYTRKTKNGEMVAKVVWPEENVKVLLTRKEVWINGNKVPTSESKKMIKTPNNKMLAELYNYSDYYELHMFGRVTVRVTDHVEIIPEYRLQNVIRGICGDFDGEKTFEFTGPKKCLYRNKELFKFAYTIPEGENCDINQFKTFEKKVMKFQENCEKRPSPKQLSSTLKTLYESKHSECYELVYPVHKKGSSLCLAQEPVQRCAKTCAQKHKELQKVMVKCWPKREAPNEVKRGLTKGYVPHPVNAPAKFMDHLEVSAVKSCRKL